MRMFAQSSDRITITPDTSADVVLELGCEHPIQIQGVASWTDWPKESAPRRGRLAWVAVRLWYRIRRMFGWRPVYHDDNPVIVEQLTVGRLAVFAWPISLPTLNRHAMMIDPTVRTDYPLWTPGTKIRIRLRHQACRCLQCTRRGLDVRPVVVDISVVGVTAEERGFRPEDIDLDEQMRRTMDRLRSMVGRSTKKPPEDPS